MNDNIIEINNLSKLYRLGEVGTGTLSHDLNRWWARIRGKEDPFSTVGQINDRTKEAISDYVWALKDIDLQVKQGEVLGIIGGNGAGKSTLLKLISRITSPTTGIIKARGRIASLLEVGTGMHPEMTARENIYLNGTIMGMRRQEIKEKFDDIIDFAGCSMFVDTPIKRYSTGMRVRLGFAVAAFLEPEILIVDEVLAVGDAEFQKRAIGKMKEITGQDGRTILFVSHNMSAVRNLCSKVVVLEQGKIKATGDVNETIITYMHPEDKNRNILNHTKKSEVIELKNAKIKYYSDYRAIDIAKSIELDFQFEHSDFKNDIFYIVIFIYTEGVCAFSKWSYPIKKDKKGEFLLNFKIPPNTINDNYYTIDLKVVCRGSLLAWYENVILFHGVDNTSKDFGNTHKMPGVVRPKIEIQIEE